MDIKNILDNLLLRSFKGNIFNRIKRHKRYKILTRLAPLTSSKISFLSVGNMVVIIKRNHTYDSIALAMGSVFEQPANEIVVWRVFKVHKGSVYMRDPNGQISILNETFPRFVRRNLIITKPNFLSQDFYLRLYYK